MHFLGWFQGCLALIPAVRQPECFRFCSVTLHAVLEVLYLKNSHSLGMLQFSEVLVVTTFT
jgi:hypothetical protein